MRVAKPVVLTSEQRATLVKWSRGRSTPARLVQPSTTITVLADHGAAAALAP